jgi:hypothetical protein
VRNISYILGVPPEYEVVANDVKSFVGSELELIMLVLVCCFFTRKKLNFIEEGSWGCKPHNKAQVDG